MNTLASRSIVLTALLLALPLYASAASVTVSTNPTGGFYQNGYGEVTAGGPLFTNPHVSVTYSANVYNASGNLISPGGSVNTGDTITLRLSPLAGSDISWYPETVNAHWTWLGESYSVTTAHGNWGTPSSPPADLSNVNDAIGSQFFAATYQQVQPCLEEYDNGWVDTGPDPQEGYPTGYYDTGCNVWTQGPLVQAAYSNYVYAPLVLAPPTRTVTNTGGLSCGALQSDGSMSCTVTSAGALNPTFSIGATNGQFYSTYNGGSSAALGELTGIHYKSRMGSMEDVNNELFAEGGYASNLLTDDYGNQYYEYLYGFSGNSESEIPGWGGQEGFFEWWHPPSFCGGYLWTYEGWGYAVPCVDTLGYINGPTIIDIPAQTISYPLNSVQTPVADLTAGAPIVSVSSPVPNQSMTFSSVITNGGGGTASGQIPVRFQIDPNNDGNFSDAINLDKSNAVSGIASGNSKTATSPSWSSAVSGTYQVRACADVPPYPNGNVTEGNENNNCGNATSFTVQSVCYGGGCTGGDPTNPNTPVVNRDPWCQFTVTQPSSNPYQCCSTSPGVCTVAPATPTVILTATPSTVFSGQPSRLTWTSQNASSCTSGQFTTGGATQNPTTGVSTGNLTQTTQYSITCSNGWGPQGSSTATATVVSANLSISASPAIVNKGTQTTISWQVTGPVTSCSVTGTGLSASGTSGSQAVTVNTETTYTLSCLAGSSVSTKQTTVKLNPKGGEF